MQSPRNRSNSLNYSFESLLICAVEWLWQWIKNFACDAYYVFTCRCPSQSGKDVVVLHCVFFLSNRGGKMILKYFHILLCVLQKISLIHMAGYFFSLCGKINKHSAFKQHMKSSGFWFGPGTALKRYFARVVCVCRISLIHYSTLIENERHVHVRSWTSTCI